MRYLLLTLILSLAACGQKGPLYLPGEEQLSGEDAAPGAAPTAEPESDEPGKPAERDK